MFDQINKYKASFGRLFEAKTLKVMSLYQQRNRGRNHPAGTAETVPGGSRKLWMGCSAGSV